MQAARGPGEAVPSWIAGYRPKGEIEARDLARTLLLLSETSDPFDRSLPVHLTASAVVVHAASRTVLLRWHSRQGAWLQVGGHGDPGESAPVAIAMREAAEETGLGDLEPWPAGEEPALVHVVAVPVNARGDEPAHEHIDLRYVLTTGTPEKARPENSESPVRWLPLEEARSSVTANLAETLSRLAGCFEA